MAFSTASLPADAPSLDVVLRYVRGVVAEVIGQDEGLLPDALDDMALDSLSRMNITARLEQDLGPLPVSLMFEHGTVTELAGHLRETHPAALAELLGAPAPGAAAAAGTPPPAAQVHDPEPGADTAPAPEFRPAPGIGDIAVIGVCGRYPGSPDMDAFWETLRTGANRVTEVPEDRWDWRRYHDPRRGQVQKSYGKWGAFLDDVTGFDTEFFNILPSSAEEMDPQERLFLETTWNLLEETGYLGVSTHERSTGVFVGTMYDTYGRMGATGWVNGRLVGPDAQPWLLANRISYHFDFQGPSFAVNSACSSSLTAVHLACESLRREECRMAIAGGANLILHPAHMVGLAAMNMLAADGRCKVFDARADGFVPGEGVGAVLLKPLEAAVADNDRIWGVIKSSFVNTAGRTSGFTVPSSTAQAVLLAEAIRRAGVPPSTIGYIEAHGTGTELGDPIELAGMAAALVASARNGEGGDERARCAVGSVKANIGHLEGASGIAGLTKVLLQLKHRQIAPCINLTEVNPKIESASGRFSFPVELTDWTTEPGVPRRAGVSAFGAGGANAHLIVEEYPGGHADREASAAQGQREELLLLSARTTGQLRTLVERTVELLASVPPPSLRSLAYTSQVRRMEMPARLAVLARNTEELVAGLASFVRGEPSPRICHGTVGPGDASALPLRGEEGEAFIDALRENRRLLPLAQIWVQGAPVDWSSLWPGPRPFVTPLPPYPFDRKHYWVPAEDQSASPAPPPAAPAGVSSPQELASSPDTPAPEPAQAAPPPPSPLRAAIERELRLIATTYLLVDESEVDSEAELTDLGFDSISLVGLIGQLCDTYDVEFEAVVVFDHPSLSALARYVETEHHAAAAAYHGTKTS